MYVCVEISKRAHIIIAARRVSRHEPCSLPNELSSLPHPMILFRLRCCQQPACLCLSVCVRVCMCVCVCVRACVRACVQIVRDEKECRT